MVRKRALISCLAATRLISESAERKLRVRERLALALHLAICGLCRNFDRQVPLLGQMMRRFSTRADDANTHDHARSGPER